MDISTIKQKIAALEAEIVPNSVSPERVASILSDITSLVENMGYLGYEFLGVATPTASPSFDKDLTAKKYFYIAVQQGTYTNFGGLTVGANDGLTILAYNGTWTKTATGTAMKTDITSLKTSVTNINTKILPLSVSFDLDKIDALTDSSGSTDIKAAFTPLSGIGVAPVAGNILRSGNVIKNSQEVAVIWSDYDSKTAYYSFSYVIDNVLKIFQTDAKTFVRVAKTIVDGDVGAEIEDLQDRVSIGKAPVWITMTLEGEPHDPTRDNIGDIIFFEEGNYLKEVVRSAQGGKTLGQAVDMETGRLYVYGGNLCKWEDGDFVPFYLDGINTLKSKARYEYSLSKILALTDTSEESAVEEAFTPTYDPEGSLAPRVPKAGDLLIDGNNTVVVSEGTQIFFSFTYQEEIISMRVYGGGSSFRFNVWKFPAGTVYDFNSIDTLTESSTADDIKKALTPKIGDGMRIPNSGDIMLIGIEENPDTVSVLYRYRNTFAYYHNRLLTTIEVEGEDDSLRVVKTISRNYVYDFDKINALTNASTFSDIMHAFSPLIIGTEGHIPKTGDLLTSGYDEEGNAARSAKVICHNGNSFAYCYGGKHVTVELVGDFLGSPDMKIEKTVTDLEGAKVFDLTKIDSLTGSSSSTDVQAAFTVDGKQSVPQVGDILRTNGTDYPYNEIVVYAQSTDNGEGIKSFKYLSGTTIRAIQVMPDFSAVNVTETDLMEMEYEPKKYDYDKVMALSNDSTQLDVNEAFTPIGGDSMEWPMPGDLLVSTDDRNHVIILANQRTTASNAATNIRYIYGNIFLRNISIRNNPRFSISVVDIDLDKEVEGSDVEFSLQLHNGDLLAICKEGEIRPSDEIHFYRRGRYSTNLHSDISSRYRNRKDGWRNSNNYSGWVDIDQGYETYIPYEFDKEKLEQGVNGNPKLIGMDVWKLTAVEDQSGFADPFPALFRSAMVRLYTDPNAPSPWEVCIRDGRNGKSYDWYDYQKFMPYPNMEIRKTVHAGVAVHRNNRRISDIVPFKIRFHLINDGTLSEEVPPTIDDNYVRVTLRI